MCIQVSCCHAQSLSVTFGCDMSPLQHKSVNKINTHITVYTLSGTLTDKVRSQILYLSVIKVKRMQI